MYNIQCIIPRPNLPLCLPWNAPCGSSRRLHPHCHEGFYKLNFGWWWFLSGKCELCFWSNLDNDNWFPSGWLQLSEHTVCNDGHGYSGPGVDHHHHHRHRLCHHHRHHRPNCNKDHFKGENPQGWADHRPSCLQAFHAQQRWQVGYIFIFLIITTFTFITIVILWKLHNVLVTTFTAIWSSSILKSLKTF